MNRISALCVLTLLATGCQDGTSFGTTNGGTFTADGFALAVTQAGTRSSLGGVEPSTGRIFLDVTVEITNAAATPPVAANFADFSVKTADALSVTASAFTALADQPCAADTGVASGGKLDCHVVFEIATAAHAVELDYFDPATMRSASAPIATAGVPFSISDGKYVAATTPKPSVMDGCLTLARFNHDSLFILNEAEGGLSLVDPALGSSVTEVLLTWDGANTWRYQAKPSTRSDAGCAYLEAVSIEMVATYNDEFDWKLDVSQTQHSSSCAPVTIDCVTEMSAHFTRD